MREIHLICNAHIDTMWLWEWEEGAAETLSTFRTAARLAEETEDFVFCHNEALLYEWIEEYEPSLFAKIQKLVAAGKWKIMGGWYLQPDCNMPSGEAFIRQITCGNDYFMKKFGVRCDTAVNFDSFGHSRGLVQIMKKFGYENYLICRPTRQNEDIPDEFIWVGYDGSEIYTRRHFELYNSPLGGARDKISSLIKEKQDSPLCILWGVGNHGGGPSEKDLKDLAELKTVLKEEGVDLIHSDPDRYFKATKKAKKDLVKIERSLTRVNTGCFTSQAFVKKLYRKLERELFSTEKIMAVAVMQGLMEWDETIKEAEKDMLFAQFHDALPGTVVKSSEEVNIRAMYHGLNILSKIKIRAYFALCNKIKYKPRGNYPVLVWNPLSYETERTVEVEFQLADQNWGNDFTFMHVIDEDGKEVPSQIEKENSNLNLDWRKHVVFTAKLKPTCVNFFECVPYKAQKRGNFAEVKEIKTFSLKDTTVNLDFNTGLICAINKGGKNYVYDNALRLVVWSDTEDPWAMQQDDKLGVKIGNFALLPPKKGSEYSGVKKTIPSCRIIEDGEVRTVVEAVFFYGLSRARYRYYFNKREDNFGLDIAVVFAEKDKCLKLETKLRSDGEYSGQKSFGREALRSDGSEDVFLNWCGVFKGDGFTVVNDGTYGGSYDGEVLSLSLLRTAAYTGHPILNREILPQDRYTDRIDIGERNFTFQIAVTDRNGAERLATLRDNPLTAFSFFPNGNGKDDTFIAIDSPDITLSAFYKKGDGFAFRLYNGSDKAVKSVLRLKALGVELAFELKPFEFKTYEYKNGAFCEAAI